MVWHGKGWDPPCDIAQDTPHEDDNHNSIHTRTALSVASHQDGSEKYATDGPKSLHARNNITIVSWSVRSLRAAGKVEELTHEMMRY